MRHLAAVLLLALTASIAGAQDGFAPDEAVASARVRVGTPRVQGPMSVAHVRRVARQRQQRMRMCYRRELHRRPLRGSLELRLVIDAEGNVQNARIDAVQEGFEGVAECIAGVGRRMHFRRSNAAGVIVARVPLILTF